MDALVLRRCRGAVAPPSPDAAAVGRGRETGWETGRGREKKSGAKKWREAKKNGEGSEVETKGSEEIAWRRGNWREAAAAGRGAEPRTKLLYPLPQPRQAATHRSRGELPGW